MPGAGRRKNERGPVVFLMGPTGAGKTALAMDAVSRLPMEIINVDSALVYRGLEIGAACPTKEELAKAPHRLLGFRDPSEPYSAADFRTDALAEIEDIQRRGKVPLLVGGTMLYFKALLEGLVELPLIDPTIREAIEADAQRKGWPALHAELAEGDPEAAAAVHPNHSQRICRALEVLRGTGKPISTWQLEQGEVDLPYRILQIAIGPEDRAVLHRRIDQRLEQMFAAGFIDEVKKLHRRGDLHGNLPAIRAVGYRQVWDYLDGEFDEADMRSRALYATRQLAKRQYTWLRKWPDLHWIVWNDDKISLLPEVLALLADVDFQVDGLY